MSGTCRRWRGGRCVQRDERVRMRKNEALITQTWRGCLQGLANDADDVVPCLQLAVREQADPPARDVSRLQLSDFLGRVHDHCRRVHAGDWDAAQQCVDALGLNSQRHIDGLPDGCLVKVRPGEVNACKKKKTRKIIVLVVAFLVIFVLIGVFAVVARAKGWVSYGPRYGSRHGPLIQLF